MYYISCAHGLSMTMLINHHCLSWILELFFREEGAYNIDSQELESRYKSLQRTVHPDKFSIKSEVWWELWTSEIKVCLMKYIPHYQSACNPCPSLLQRLREHPCSSEISADCRGRSLCLLRHHHLWMRLTLHWRALSSVLNTWWGSRSHASEGNLC